jgi:hypothetical protein
MVSVQQAVEAVVAQVNRPPDLLAASNVHVEAFDFDDFNGS